MFRSFYLYRVSRPIASSVKRQVSAAREISARLASIAVTIAFASRRIDKPCSTWHLNQMFVTVRGEPYLL
jgi:hypothetical protein